MERNSSAPEAQQLSLFDEPGTTLTALDVTPLEGDPKAIRAAASELLTLVRYHEARVQTGR